MANAGIRKLVVFVQKRFLNTIPTSPPTQASNFTLDFLTNSCGLPLKSAISLSQKLQFQQEKEKKLQSVINYLKDEGFTQTHIATLVLKNPQVLKLNVETILKPKLEFLKQNGFVGELLIELLVRNSSIVSRSLCSQTISFQLLKYYLKSDDKIVSAIRRSSWLLMCNFKRIMQPNIDFLIKEGLPYTSIARLITWHPRTVTFKHSRTVYTVHALKNLGFQPNSPAFVRAFSFRISSSESTWKKKMALMQSYGWSEEDVLTAFKSSPAVMGYSEGRIRKLMDFYLNTAKLDLQSIITHPAYLSYAIDRRVHPRYIVFKILKSKKLIKEDTQLISLLVKTEEYFLEKYVSKYEEIIPNLLETYTSAKRQERLEVDGKETQLGSAK